MKVLEVRNVHEALPRALRLLRQEAVYRESRNGPVYVTPYPVTTVYNRPSERVMLWPQRDANPFFHLYNRCGCWQAATMLLRSSSMRSRWHSIRTTVRSCTVLTGSDGAIGSPLALRGTN